MLRRVDCTSVSHEQEPQRNVDRSRILELGRRRGEFDRPRVILADSRYLVARIRALGIGTQMENDVETGSAAAHLLGLDGISIEFAL